MTFCIYQQIDYRYDYADNCICCLTTLYREMCVNHMKKSFNHRQILKNYFASERPIIDDQ